MKREEYNGEYDAFETPDNLWSNIESKLDTQTKRRRPLIYWISAGAAAVIVGVFALTQFVTPEKETEQKIAHNTQGKQQTPKSASEGNQTNNEYDFKKIESAAYDSDQQSTLQSQQNYEIAPGAVYHLKDATSSNPFASGNGNGSNTYSWSYGSDMGSSSGYRSVSSPTFSSRMKNKESEKFLGFARLAEPIESTHGSTYDAFNENDFKQVKAEPQSTFSIDVDGASYSDVRGMINRNVLPNPNAVRLEEFINYFPYNYSEPKGDHPFSIHSEVVDCPWNGEHKLMKIGIKGESIPVQSLPKNNLVFLLDVSGSMMSADKLELLKKGFNLLVQEMREQDKVSICVYAGAAGLVLPPTSGAHKDKIMDAINRLEAGGSTAGGEGIELAYNTAIENFDPNGNNRVILATDGDFNVGLSDDNALVKLIEEKRKSGVYLTVLGFGHDNFQSSKMEKLANNGNGNFSYIDNILEAKKVLVTEMGATLKTIAKDVKIQLDFNPEKVESYRLIGYENRLLANEDFDNDAVDAGELGAGHTVTAVYEVVPAGIPSPEKESGSSRNDAIRASIKDVAFASFDNGEFAILKFRYKKPNESTSRLIKTTISNLDKPASADMQFISAVIEFGLILRDSKYKGTASFQNALRNARLGLGRDPYGYRSEFIQLVQKAQRLSDGSSTD